MNLVSVNIMGLGSGPKRATLKILIEKLKPGVLFLQETMSLTRNACDYFLKLKPNWRLVLWMLLVCMGILWFPRI